MTGRKSTEVDIAVGQRIRRFRQNAKLSQMALAKIIGVSAQQVQKYESGADRVGVGRLMLIAAALDVPIIDFFARLAPHSWNRKQAVRLSTVMTTPRADKLLSAFLLVSDQSIQSALIDLARTIRENSRRRKS
jgi:transcriptional regulator with XRE-family HTH domain